MKREEQLALKKDEYEGKVYPSNRFGDIKILEYKNNKQVVIKFLNTGFITEESLFKTKNYGDVEVIEYIDSHNITVKFN